jgi:hypothetical protein
MTKRAILAGAMLIGSPTMASDIPPEHVVVSETNAAIRAKDTKGLEWLVSRVGTMQFSKAELTQKADALKALSGCKAKEKKRDAFGPLTYYEFEWKCARQSYVGKLVPDKGGRSVALIDFLTKTEYEVILKRFPSLIDVPPPIFTSIGPPPFTPEETEAQKAKRKAEMAKKVDYAGQFAKSFAENDMTPFAERHSTYSTITYGFFNPFLDQEFIDHIWKIEYDVPDAGKTLAEVVAYTHARLGKPTSWTCDDADPYVECTWHYEDPATKLKSQILVFYPGARDWGIKLFWLRYETAEKLQEAKRRASLPS